MKSFLTTFAAALVLCLHLGVAPAVAGVESFVTVPGPQGPLKGTMLAPATGPHRAVVVIIPGSGPTDRDGNSALGVRASTYRLLAEELADRGVTSIRIDKRGMFASAAAIPEANQVTIADYAVDAHAWAAEAKRLTGARCAWLLGHSEGSLVALAAAQDPKDICGLVLVAGAGRKLSDVLREQLRSNPANAPLLPEAMKAIDDLEAGRRVEVAGMNQALLPLFNPAVQNFVINAFSYDPATLVREFRGPVLVVQGATDLQVGMVDAQRLAGARPHVKLVTLEGVNHVLKAAPVDRRANVATYTDPSLPLAPGVADEISSFISR